MAMVYDWISFNLKDALAGRLVGFQEEDPSDLTSTGVLQEPGPLYRLEFNGYKLKVNTLGVVQECVPENANYNGATVQMVVTSIGDTAAVGTSTSRTRAAVEGHDNTVLLNTMEPRDYFAIYCLSSMLIHSDHPENMDDARRMRFARASYSWAQAMMIAAADSREGQSTKPSTTVDIKSGDLESNIEKLLYNMTEYMKKGVTIKGTTESGTAPVQTKITETPALNINGLNNITDSYIIPDRGTVNIKVGIYKTNYIRIEVLDYMAYSDISLYFLLAVKEGETVATRKISHIVPKGSVVLLIPLDSAVTDITAITSMSVRGKGGNDPNEYYLVEE